MSRQGVGSRVGFGSAHALPHEPAAVCECHDRRTEVYISANRPPSGPRRLLFHSGAGVGTCQRQDVMDDVRPVWDDRFQISHSASRSWADIRPCVMSGQAEAIFPAALLTLPASSSVILGARSESHTASIPK